MAVLDYKKRLRNLEERRFSSELRKSFLSESYNNSTVSDRIKYMIESMMPIERDYDKVTIQASQRVRDHLERKYNLHFKRDYRSQGSAKTKTNIKVHSDYDLLVIISKYYYHSPDIENNNPYNESNPVDDIKVLRKQSENILNDIYDEVDITGTKSIAIYNKSLKRKVDVVFCYWYNTRDYFIQNDEYYRGVYLFDFTKNEKIKDFPFAHIHEVNKKGSRTNDGSRKGIRLLKTLKVDSGQDIKLSSFHLTTLVHGINDNDIYYHKRGSELIIARAMSLQISKLITDSYYRKYLKCPNGTETPFSDDKTIPELIKLKEELDQLINDVEADLLIPINEHEIKYY